MKKILPLLLLFTSSTLLANQEQHLPHAFDQHAKQRPTATKPTTTHSKSHQTTCNNIGATMLILSSLLIRSSMSSPIEISSGKANRNLLDSTPYFIKALGGSGNDFGGAIEETASGEILFSGYTYGYGAGRRDTLLGKLTASGTPLWAQALGGINQEYSTSIIEVSTKDIAFTGAFENFEGNWDILIGSYSANGSLIWAKSLGGSDFEFSYSIIERTNGRLLISGETHSYGAGQYDALLIDFYPNGTDFQAITLGDTSFENAEEVIETKNGDLVFVGYTMSFGPGVRNVFIVRLSANKTLLWARSSDGLGTEHGYAIIEANNSDLVLVGRTNSYEDNSYYILIQRSSSNGTLLWSTIVGGGDQEYGYSIKEVENNNLLITGFTLSYGAGRKDILLALLRADGPTIWTKTSGGTDNDYGSAIKKSANGGAFFIGTTSNYGSGGSDIIMGKIDTTSQAEDCFIPANMSTIDITPNTSWIDISHNITLTPISINITDIIQNITQTTVDLQETEVCWITNIPTPTPTNAPTTPTQSPTNAPTNLPTNTPTNLPTSTPTQSPTNTPTNLPTSAPTQSPTNNPIESPTNTPTQSPTETPINLPTSTPTQSPTETPTNLPTNTPTSTPTQSPTPTPTNLPTSTPTQSPTISPTDTPTLKPSYQPTHEPTENPTLITYSPSIHPTHTPTTIPTFNPSYQPTHQPTENPTLVTSEPTVNPTKQKSLRKSDSTAKKYSPYIILGSTFTLTVSIILLAKNTRKKRIKKTENNIQNYLENDGIQMTEVSQNITKQITSQS